MTATASLLTIGAMIGSSWAERLRHLSASKEARMNNLLRDCG